MSRYIDADAYAAEMKVRQDALKELIDDAVAMDNWEMYDGLSREFSVFVEAKLTLDAMPTVDAVPVVRCRDCQWFDFDCPMHDWTYGLHETRQNVLVCNARHGLEPILSRVIQNGDERPDWGPIKGEVEYARMVHERIMDEIKDNVSMKRLEEELFVLCKEK